MYPRIIIAVAINLAFHTGAVAQSEGAARFLLLKNGQMIAGSVESGETTTAVIKPSGSRIIFPNSKVELAAKTKSEVYWTKCAQISAIDLDGHVSLFRWCILNELFEEAQNQIELMQQMNIAATRLLDLHESLQTKRADHQKRVESERYAISQLPDLESTSNTVSEEHSKTVAGVARLQKSSKGLPTQLRSKGLERPLNEVQQVGYDAPINLSDRARLLEKLDETTNSLSPDAVVMFKRTIEPLMINSCYTAKCHSNDSDPMPLAVLGKNRPVPKRMSQRNLMNLLKYTDVNKPLDSKLFAAAALPHAGQDKPIIKINSPQFQSLRIWLVAISSAPHLFHQTPPQFFDSDLRVATDVRAKTANKDSSTSPPEKAPEIADAAELRKIDSNVADIESSVPEKDNKPSNEIDPPQKDPFDPEVFNRRYLKRR